MATSSIRKNFVVSGKGQIEEFVKALETSAKSPYPSVTVKAKTIHTSAEVKGLLALRRKTRASRATIKKVTPKK